MRRTKFLENQFLEHRLLELQRYPTKSTDRYFSFVLFSVCNNFNCFKIKTVCHNLLSFSNDKRSHYTRQSKITLHNNKFFYYYFRFLHFIFYQCLGSNLSVWCWYFAVGIFKTKINRYLHHPPISKLSECSA